MCDYSPGLVIKTVLVSFLLEEFDLRVFVLAFLHSLQLSAIASSYIYSDGVYVLVPTLVIPIDNNVHLVFPGSFVCLQPSDESCW